MQNEVKIEKYSGLHMKDGQPVMTQQYIDTLRQQILSKTLTNWIVPQSGGQERMLSQDVDILICGGSRGGPLPVDTKVVTPNGHILLKDINGGEMILGFDGKPQKVICREDFGMLSCFKFTFEDGAEIVSSYDHLWRVKVSSEDKWMTLTTLDVDFLLYTKADVCIPAYKGGVRRIKESVSVGSAECSCIKVENKDSLFLVNDFIVTHNSKSFSLLMEAMKDIQNPDFHAILLRNNKKAMEKLIRDSRKLYFQYGTYNRAQNDMTWYFTAGGTLEFKYHDDTDEDFKERFQGQEYAYIGIDEITHISYKKFKYLTTCNRNAYGIRNRMWGTCNPDPRSWVRQFIDWWVDKDGYINPERDGKIRYCFMKGERINNIVWGDTRDEVYKKCKEDIDLLWTPEYEEMGLKPEEVFIQSVTFVRADLSQNPMLLLSDPSYLGRLGAQDRAQVMRDLKANWNATDDSDDLVSFDDMEAVFENSYQFGDRSRYVTGDIALEGGDNLILWLWEGWHVKDMFVCRTDSKRTAALVRHQLKVWGVDESRFCYDGQGIGTYIKGFFPRALKFIAQASPMQEPSDDDDDENDEEDVKYAYKDLKSQCAFLLYLRIKDLGLSFESGLLDREVSGNGYDGLPLRQILQKERMVIKRDTSIRNKGFSLMPKRQSKQFIGHSPDFFDALIYREYFELADNTHTEIEGAWMLSADDEMDFDEQNDTLGLLEYIN